MRNTIAKAKILELINHSEVALSHSEIEKLTEGLCNRVTIYRVLDRLTDEGHIHRFINIDGHQKFAACLVMRSIIITTRTLAVHNAGQSPVLKM